MTDWVVETLVASTLLMAIVLLLRGPVTRHFGARWAYALWLLPALRMVTPPLPAGTVETPIAALPSFELVLMEAVPLTDALPAETGLPWAEILPALWLAGAAVFLGWQAIAYRRFMRRALRNAEQLPGMDREGVEVCASPAVPGPFATGIFVKQVVLPADWRRRYEAEELRLAMAHELQHHRRCDLSANLVALVVLAIHWWNPLAHIAHRAFRADQELACDALVLAGASVGERQAYGQALVKSAIARRPAALAPLGNGHELKRRLKMMGRTGGSGRGGAIATAALVAAGLAATASGGVAAETGRSVAEETVQAVREVALPPSAADPLDVPAARDALDPVTPAEPAPVRQERRVSIITQRDGQEVRRDWSELSEAERQELRTAMAEARAGLDRARIGLEAAQEARQQAARARERATENAARAHQQASAAHARSVAEAAQARRRGVEAQMEANRAAMGARIAAEQAQRRSHMLIHRTGPGGAVQIRGCQGQANSVRVEGPGQSGQVVACGVGINEAELNRIMANALRQARASLAAEGEVRVKLTESLAALDAEIARLEQE